MARSRSPKPTRAGLGSGCDNQHGTRSARGCPPRAFRAQKFNPPLIETHHELGHDDESLLEAWERLQANWKLREEHQQSNGFLSTGLYDSSYSPTSDLLEERTRFSYPASSRPHQVTDSVSAFGAGSSRAGSLTYNRQLHQHRLSHPPPSSLSPGRKAQQRRASPRAYEDNLEESLHRPLSPSPANAVDRFSQGRSYLSSASIQPRDYADTPIHQPQIVIPAEPSTQNLRGLTRRPRVQASRKRVSWVRANGSTRRSVDLEVPQLTEMDYSVMSVRRPNPDRSGTGLSSSFVLPPTSVRPTVIGRSETEERHLGASPSSHVSSETEPPRSRIKAQGAGPASANAYSIPGKEPHTMALPSLMNNMEEEWPSSSPVSTPKAPRLDQRSVIREDLQQQDDERPIAGRRTDPRISFGEAAAVDDRKSLDLVRSTSPLEVSHLQSHAAPANKGDDRKPPRQQALFQELYQMLEDPDSEILRSGVEVHRGGDSGEGIIRQDCVIEGSTQDTPRVPGGPEETLHMDVLLAQRVARDAMQEDGECFGWSCKLSASECGEEAVDPNSNWLECGLDRKYSTRSVFDWRYA